MEQLWVITYDHGPVFKRGQGKDTDSEEDGHSPQEMLKKLKQTNMDAHAHPLQYMGLKPSTDKVGPPREF
jgi:hypothetical protein